MTEAERQQRLELADKRNYIVSKSNTLIQKSRYSLTTQEQKIILYVISKIKPGQEHFDEYRFSLRDLCDVCGIQYNGKNYQNFKESISSLADKSFWMNNGNEEILCRWIAKAKIIKNELEVVIRLDEDLKPYLLGLRDNFTSYELENVLVMKSKFSIRLYELLKSYAYVGYFDIDLDELKKVIATDYSRYDNFRRFVLDKAKQEINEFTDLTIDYKPKRTGQKITAIHFEIQSKEDFDYTKTSLRRTMVLNGGVSDGR